MLIDTFISLFGLGYNYVSGIHQGKKIDEIVSQLNRVNSQFEKIAEHIFYDRTQFEVIDANKNTQSVVDDLRSVRESLEPLQRVSNGDLLSSAMILTPEMLKSSLQINPWKVLDSIRPAQYAEPHINKDMIPILFSHDGHNYIGWQMKGVIPSLFGCEFYPKDISHQDEDTEISGNSKLIDSIGIETLGGEFTTLVEKDAALPVEVSQVFSTAEDNQTAVTVNVLIGYGSFSSETTSIGRFDLEDIPPAPRGVPQIEITCKVNEKGKLHLYARDQGTGYFKEKEFFGIRVSGSNVSNSRVVISCVGCAKKLRIPSNKHITVKCPNCSRTFNVKNGIIY